MDTFTHAWDLARATGQPTNLDPKLADTLLEAARPYFADVPRDGRRFAEPQPTPADATPADCLAAFFGRTV